MSKTLCIGHRGAKGYLPENTLPSFERAIEMGCEWIELDVYLVEDSLVVIHDETVERTTNGKGKVSALSLDYLRSLDAGDGARIPLLEEVIDLVDGRCGINVELKGEGTAVAVSRLLKARGVNPSGYLISSFSHPELSQADPDFPRGALFGKLLKDQWQRAERLNAWSVNFDKKDVTQSLVDEAHSRGYQVLVYTANKPGHISRLIEFGVDGIFSDFPDRVLKLRDH